MDEDHETHVEAVQHLKEAVSRYEEGSYDGMAMPLERCLNLDGSLTLAWEMLGLYCLHSVAMKDALFAFERAEMGKGRSPEAEVALKLMRSSTWPQGEELLDGINGLVALGQAYLSAARWRAALLCFRSAEPHLHMNWQIHSIMGLIYRELGLLEVSLENYERASAMEGAPEELLHDRSVVLIKLGRFREAEELLSRLLEDIDDDPQLWNNLGAVLEAQGKDKQALEAYDRAISLDDGYYPALYSKGRIFQKQGRMDEARPILEKALDIEGRVYDLDDVTTSEERSGDDMVHMKEVTLSRHRKKVQEEE